MSQLWNLLGLHGLCGTLWSGDVLLLPHHSPLLSNTVEQLRLPFREQWGQDSSCLAIGREETKAAFPWESKAPASAKVHKDTDRLVAVPAEQGQGQMRISVPQWCAQTRGRASRCVTGMKGQMRPKPGHRRWPIPRDPGSHAGEWGPAPFLLPAPTWLNFSKRLRTVVPSQDSIDDLQVLSWDLQRAPLAPCLPDGPWPKWLWQSEQAGQYHSLSSAFFQKRCSDWRSCFIFSILGTVVTGQSTDNIQPEMWLHKPRPLLPVLAEILCIYSLFNTGKLLYFNKAL